MIDAPPDHPPLPKRPFAEALVDCGLRRDGFTITYDKDADGNVIAISLRAGAKAGNLQCIWDAAWTEFVSFDDKALQAAYDRITQSYFAPIAQRQAREDLARRGLLNSLPERSKFASLEDFAVAIEKHCGFTPRQILRVQGEEMLLQPAPGSRPDDYEKVGCIFSALVVSGQEKFGFVGNEHIAE